ncbi:flagellar basal body L-ring protein FlgH, partial [Buchnera aphidicola]|nr:flagellar basal body L-ring protein FlgH [Buchnera aphidicola]
FLPGQFDPIFGIHIDDIKISLDSAGKNEFLGKSNNSAKNTFHGLITVTIQKILPNGNLQITGEKQVAINEEIEFIRFSGI